jgi:CPA1 family monovalent cation:H+ antiporter
MRGLVTLATAFALPAAFPQRDLIVLTAFAVVLATLVVQGLTLAPLVRVLKLDGDDGLATELADIRTELASTALTALEGKRGALADHWRYAFATDGGATTTGGAHDRAQARRQMGLHAMRAQRQRLETLRGEQRVGPDAFLILQEELDFAETALTSEGERHIEES